MKCDRCVDNTPRSAIYHISDSNGDILNVCFKHIDCYNFYQHRKDLGAGGWVKVDFI